jgi:hypothetical protein
VYLAVVLAVLRAWGVADGGAAAELAPAGPLHRPLVRALVRRDPARWDEHAATWPNLVALLNQAGLGASVRVGAGAWRALVPRRGRRAPLRVGPVALGGRAR